MNALVIAPHMDDEVLGCASFLREKAALVYMTHVHPAFRDGSMVKANAALLQWLGNPAVTHLDFPGNQLDSTPQHPMIMEIERAIDDVRPDTVVLPYPSFNQDHRATYTAALTALRPHDKLHAVKRVLIYEQPEVLGTLRNDFQPQYYRPVDPDFKWECMQFYPQVIRGHRSADHLTALARIRGYQAGMEFAEAFEVLRWVD